VSWLPDPTVLEGLAIVGATSGALGCFAFLRRQSLLSDTLAHAALPGVCLAFLFNGAKDNVVLLTGALAAGVAGSLLFLAILRGSRLRQDAALGIVLSSFFGLGILLLSMLQGGGWLLEAVGFEGAGQQSGLKQFIFGQVAFLTNDYLMLMRILSGAVLAALFIFYKELKLVSFDAEYATTLGFRRRLLELLFAALIVAVVMLSLRAVGVVLTVALLVAPAAAARQWTERLGIMILLAMVIGTAAGIGGAFSSLYLGSAAGPGVVIAATLLLGFSLLIAPRRGLLWNWIRQLRHRARVRRENLLTDFYRLGERQRDWQHTRTAADLAAVRHQQSVAISRTLHDLLQRGLVQAQNGHWLLTDLGLTEAARVVRNHRLWELYLARRLELAADHVHRDAEAMEHALPPDIIAELEETLESPELDPHGNPIPHAT
jgi:manganese/zinc/iron transport system permease protein